MDSFYDLFDKGHSSPSFDAISIKIASPEKILSWSSGEVRKPETINYRTFKPERDGLFCGKIFGPVKDWECICGKYKRMKYKGVVCEKCGVEVTLSKVRRERLGHIELASPVAHIWYYKGLPSRIGNLLDMSIKDLVKILYFEKYIVLEAEDDIPEKKIKKGNLITEEEYIEFEELYGDSFRAGMGAEAIDEMLRTLDLEQLSVELKEQHANTSSVQNRKKIIKRLKLVNDFLSSSNKPEWMILKVIPVIPPELRPLVPLDGGRFATSDLNDLYRRVINRNNRLKRLLDLKAPEMIIRNEKRMLQEAVGALFDNGRGGHTLKGANKRPLKSLSDMLKGKQGRFRQNLLGKRVDYSGRSVIVVGPELKFNQCGLPQKMAIELFKPFIFYKLSKKGIVTTIKSAKRMVDSSAPEIWEVLEEVVKEHVVLLNRAPTLHRLGIQAFQPVLVEGKAIRLHPMVCTAFNADFDGDQMAVHLPLSTKAQVEAKVLMLSSNNILSPASGKPIAVPTQDIILGCYYMTKVKGGVKGENRLYASLQEVRSAYDAEELDLNARITVRINGEMEDTTTGRIVLYEVFPKELPFSLANRLMTKGVLSDIVFQCYQKAGRDKTVTFLDALKRTGFKYATKAGISISLADMTIPPSKPKMVDAAKKEVAKVEKQYRDGLITNGERYNKIVDIWAHTTEQISNDMFKILETEDEKLMQGVSGSNKDFNSVFIMADSGARGSSQQIRQLAGMRGLMAKPSGEIIETPITANFREGLTVLQYFISTHGARKGLADTALKTANSGYLTRRLVDVAQDIIILEDDCETTRGIEVEALIESGEVIQPLGDRILGRIALEDILDPFNKDLLLKKNEEIGEKAVQDIDNAGVEKVKIRSVLTCNAKRGVCKYCYGRNLATGQLVEHGEAVGVIAAQSIGEPGTQLTMRTFHIGGAASRVLGQTNLHAKRDGIVRYVEIKTLINKDGEIVVMNRNGSIRIEDSQGREKERHKVLYGAKLRVRDGQTVSEGDIFVEWDPYTTAILSDVSGKIAFGDILEGVTFHEQTDEITGLVKKVVMSHREEKMRPRVSIKDLETNKTIGRYMLPSGSHIAVSEGETIFAGDPIAKIPRETTKTKDITGGLPRVAELFEARRPQDKAVISEIDGIVELGGFKHGKRVVTVIGDIEGDAKEYLIPRGKYLSVHSGDRIRAGEPMMDGAIDPHDILNVLGLDALQKYIVNEVQEVYRLQGVQINDKHIELIVRQMVKHIKIENAGDTDMLEGKTVPRSVFEKKNDDVIAVGGTPAVGKVDLLGITKSSLSTDSFISAASFQETTRILTEVSIAGETDNLKGLKENVIVGRLIPAGTGAKRYLDIEFEQDKELVDSDPKDEEETSEAEATEEQIVQ
ncbi:MAG: DNA-directed RNA polymerase subunit beta' [Nitrospinota bacterium]